MTGPNKKWSWQQVHAAAAAIKRGNRKAVHHWAVMSRLALGDAVPLSDVLEATRSEVDTIMDARVRSNDGVVMALANAARVSGKGGGTAR